MGIDATTDPMRHREAVAWFSARTVVTRDAWDAMDAAGRSRAFMVSGLTNLAVVSDVHESITRAIAEGTTLADFKRQMEAQLTEAWGKPNAARVETIFRTNVQTAYNAARFEQLNRPAMRLARPFWRYSAVLDGRTTDTCKPLDQVIRPADDAWWKTHWPPLHFNCRSTVVSLSRSQAEEAGGVSTEPKTSPAQGFGATPDLSGEKLAPPANTDPVLRHAYQERAQRERQPSRGTRSAGAPPSPPSERDFGIPVASSRPHVRQTDGARCGPASAEMAGRHFGVDAMTQDAVAADRTFQPGVGTDPIDLASAMRRVGSPPGRIWHADDYFPDTPSVTTVAEGLGRAIEDGGGVAIINAIVRVDGDEYRHLLIVDAVEDGHVILRDPEGTETTRLPVTAEGFGAYVWTGEAVVARLAP